MAVVPRGLGYKRVLVPIADNDESEKAMDVACRLAEHGTTILAVAVVEVSPLLPLDAHMGEEETRARRLLDRASAIGDSYGVSVSARVLRGRDAASIIVNQAVAAASDVLVIGAPHRRRARFGAAVLGSTVEHVLKRAPCRVLVIGARQADAVTARHAAA